MKTVIVGDIHGRVDVVKRVLELGYPTVFVGDILDSYDRSVDEQIECLDLLLDAPDSVDVLYGNHELSYLDPVMRCSGYKERTHDAVLLRKGLIKDKFKEHVWLNDDVLVTHAGVSKSVCNELKDVKNYLKSPYRKVIGYYRGGLSPCGGMFWCDYNVEFIPIAGLRQVFGHTEHAHLGENHGIRKRKGNYNVDCLSRKKKVLVYDSVEDTFSSKSLNSEWEKYE
jgi:hypothetical protein